MTAGPIFRFTTVKLAALAWVLLSTPVCWAGSKDVILFQPGQSSWEWLLVPTSHDGGKRMREGKTCLFCHEGEEKTIGNLIASGKKLEPSPVVSLAGYVEIRVDATYDDKNLYLNLHWTSPVPTQAVGDEEAATHLTVMLGRPELAVAAIAGCWAACHSDLPGMPDEQAGMELSKYLPGSRNKMTKTGGAADIRSELELSTQIMDGKFLEYWQVILNQGQMKSAGDGYFLQQRMVNDVSAITATATSEGQNWSVEMVRPLKSATPFRHTLSEGVEFTLAIALHENHASGRHHYTSFPMRFVLGAGEAELKATPK